MASKSIYAQYRDLGNEQRRRALLVGCEMALAVWNRYVAEQDNLNYADTVVGAWHEVDTQLPRRSLDWLWLWNKNNEHEPASKTELWGLYAEPITALHEDDWALPIDVEYAYYAVYNFLKMVCESKFDNDAEYTIFNQIIASQLGQDQRNPQKIEAAISDWWKKVTQP